MFESKTLLITGGTGSFGNAVLNRFLQTDIWPDYTGPRHDTLDVEIYEHWLTKAGTGD